MNLFVTGPAVGGIIVEAIGFQWMLWILALVNLLFAPLLFFLRNPPGNEEKMVGPHKYHLADTYQ